MKKIYTILFLALSLTTAIGQDALRQRSNTRGLNLGVYGQYTRWGTTSDDFKTLAEDTRGGGLGLRVGYGFGHRIEAFAQVDGSYLVDAAFKDYGVVIVHLEAGGRLNLGSTTSRFRPFIDVGYSRVGASASESSVGTLNLSGGGLMGGLGANYFLTIPVALTLRLSGIYGKFSSADFDGTPLTITEKPDIGTARLSLGLTWYLRGRR